MSEPQGQVEDAPDAIEEQRSLVDVLRGLVGRRVTVISPESYEALPAGGSELREGHYVGRITGFGHDYLIFDTALAVMQRVELVARSAGRVGHTHSHTPDEHEPQPVQQFIPIARIKRVSFVKDAPTVLLHL